MWHQKRSEVTTKQNYSKNYIIFFFEFRYRTERTFLYQFDKDIDNPDAGVDVYIHPGTW